MKIPEIDMIIKSVPITNPCREIKTAWPRRPHGDHHGNPLVLNRLYVFSSLQGDVIVRLVTMPDDQRQVTYRMVFPEDRSPTTRHCFASQLVPLGPMNLGLMYQTFLSVVREYMDTVEGDLSRE